MAEASVHVVVLLELEVAHARINNKHLVCRTADDSSMLHKETRWEKEFIQACTIKIHCNVCKGKVQRRQKAHNNIQMKMRSLRCKLRFVVESSWFAVESSSRCFIKSCLSLHCNTHHHASQSGITYRSFYSLPLIYSYFAVPSFLIPVFDTHRKRA